LVNKLRGRGINRKRKAATSGRRENEINPKTDSRNGHQSSGESDVSNVMFACTKSQFDIYAAKTRTDGNFGDKADAL